MGATILEVARLVPDGLLVFMPSYSLLDRLMQRWQVGALQCTVYVLHAMLLVRHLEGADLLRHPPWLSASVAISVHVTAVKPQTSRLK